MRSAMGASEAMAFISMSAMEGGQRRAHGSFTVEQRLQHEDHAHAAGQVQRGGHVLRVVDPCERMHESSKARPSNDGAGLVCSGWLRRLQLIMSLTPLPTPLMVLATAVVMSFTPWTAALTSWNSICF